MTLLNKISKESSGTSTSLSTELVNKVPKDVWNEIFSYVPNKNILKLVCKKWRIYIHQAPRELIKFNNAPNAFVLEKLKLASRCSKLKIHSKRSETLAWVEMRKRKHSLHLKKFSLDISGKINRGVKAFDIFDKTLQNMPETMRDNLTHITLKHQSPARIIVKEDIILKMISLFPNLEQLKLSYPRMKFTVGRLSQPTLEALNTRKVTIITKNKPNGLNRINYDSKKIVLKASLPIDDICTKFPSLEIIKIPHGTSITLEEVQKLRLIPSLKCIMFETKPNIEIDLLTKPKSTPCICFKDEL